MCFIQHRLAQLHWTRDDLAAAGGPAPSTLYKAQRARRELQERTLARLECALGWQPGSGQRIIDGGGPAVRLSEQVEAATARIDAVLGVSEDAGVRQTAAELRDFLMTVVERLDGFYTHPQEPVDNTARAGVG